MLQISFRTIVVLNWQSQSKIGNFSYSIFCQHDFSRLYVKMGAALMFPVVHQMERAYGV